MCLPTKISTTPADAIIIAKHHRPPLDLSTEFASMTEPTIAVINSEGPKMIQIIAIHLLVCLSILSRSDEKLLVTRNPFLMKLLLN